MRPLTQRQRRALRAVHAGCVVAMHERSMPSLIKRRFVTAEKIGGRLTGRYFLTAAGRKELGV